MTPRGTWRLVVTAPAERGLERLPEAVAAAIIETLIVLAEKPKVLGKPLGLELEGCWSARRGPYRIVYEIDEEQGLVRVVAIGHRADIYRPR